MDACIGYVYSPSGAMHEIDYTNDQHCDDGGGNSEYSACPYGTVSTFKSNPLDLRKD
jgi:hypothetical protein